MQLGITHFELNGGRAIFTNAALGRPKLKPWHTEVVGNYVRTLPDGRIFGHRPHPTPGFHRNVPLITVDGYVRDNNLEFIDILHSDIQGEEGPMLQAATETFGAKKVGFVFISTHSDHMHAACADFLGKYGYKIIAGHSIADSFSGDGLIVAKLPTYAGPDHIPLSKRTEICSV
jgi:hypothetical protein